MSTAGSVSSGRSKLRQEAEELAGWSQQKFAVGGSVDQGGGHPPQFAVDIDLSPGNVRPTTGMIDMLGSSFHSLTYFDDSNDFHENLERFSKESKDKQNKKSAKGGVPMARQWKLCIFFTLLFIGATVGTVVGIIIYQRSHQGPNPNIVTDSGDDNLAMTTPPSPSECADVSTNPYLQCKCGQKTVSSFLPETEDRFVALQQFFSLAADVIPDTAACDNPYAVALWWMALTGTDHGDVTKTTRFVLALMYLTLDGPRWLYPTGWMSFDVDVCDWSGVICSRKADAANEDFAVEELKFDKMGLSGSLPSEIGLLQYLVGLTLSNNLLYGKLPSEVMNMKDLRLLSLEKNSLEGTLPDPTSLPNLELLTMGYNKFSGTLPASLGEWKYMQELTLESNNFSGTLPSTVASMIKVSYIDLGENAFTGPIPDISALTSLKWFVLDDNQFTGKLSENLPSSIETLDVAFNKLEGTLPSSYGQLSMLSVLNLGINNFTGTVPTEFGNMKLDYLNLASCHLTGTLPTELGLLSMIGVLNFAGNNLEGSIPQEVCDLREAGFLQELKVNCAVDCPCCVGACEGRR